MKKLLAMMLAMMMVFSLAACGDEETDGSTDSAVEGTVDATDDGSTDAEGGLNLWDLAENDVPDLSDTTWSFTGGCLHGVEMSQEKTEESLKACGGILEFVFDADGGVVMNQGGASLPGTYEYLDDGTVSMVLDNNGTEVPYICIFADLNGTQIMIAMSDDTGANGLYLVQQ